MSSIISFFNFGINFLPSKNISLACKWQKYELFLDKKVAGKSKDEQMAEKKQELEKRLLDVNDKIGNSKKAPKKG